VLALALVFPAAAAARDLPPLMGDPGCRWGAANCNPSANQLVTQFKGLRDHGDLLGFRRGPMPSVSLFHHWQGIQRLMPGGGRYVVVTRSGSGKSFGIVRMGSRDPAGERFRSNRLGAFPASTATPATDLIKTVVPALTGFDHTGGPQAVGNYLVTGNEDDDGKSHVAFYDVSDPTSPRFTGGFDHVTGHLGAGTVSIARLRDGGYLLIVGGSNAETLDFYVSAPDGSLEHPSFSYYTTWFKSQLKSTIPGDKTFGDYQNLALVTDSGGRLYLIGTHNYLPSGRDYADLFRLDRTDSGFADLVKVARRHLYCGGLASDPTKPVPGVGCNLDAAGGAYVTPSRRLLLYGAVYTENFTGVSFEEFRGAPHSTSCSNIKDAWVELYDDDGFDGDRSVMIDYVDRKRRDYTNYDRVERFEDKASAGMWCLPRGSRYRLYEDKRACGGKTRDLVGTGVPQSDRDFDDGSGLVRRFGDEVSCSKWLP
jgi:hypothetical protein